MSLFHAWRKRIPEALYGELDMKTREKMDRHLAACPTCSGLLQEMKETLEAMEEDPTPDPGAEFWEGYWDALVLRMGSEAVDARPVPSSGRQWTRRSHPWTRWALGTAAAAALLVIGFFIGRTLDRLPTGGPIPAPAVRPAAAPASAETPLLVRTSHYLKRSKVLLLAVVNFDLATGDLHGLNPPLQKKTSVELIREGAALKKELKREDPRLQRLVSELELIFLQIANLKAEGDLSEVELIRTGLEQNDILFRISLSELRRSAGKRKVQSRSQEGTAESAQTAALV
jgi:hypothetical protein